MRKAKRFILIKDMALRSEEIKLFFCLTVGDAPAIEILLTTGEREQFKYMTKGARDFEFNRLLETLNRGRK